MEERESEMNRGLIAALLKGAAHTQDGGGSFGPSINSLSLRPPFPLSNSSLLHLYLPFLFAMQ